MSLPTSERVSDETTSARRASSNHGKPSGPGLILSSEARVAIGDPGPVGVVAPVSRWRNDRDPTRGLQNAAHERLRLLVTGRAQVSGPFVLRRHRRMIALPNKTPPTNPEMAAMSATGVLCSSR